MESLTTLKEYAKDCLQEIDKDIYMFYILNCPSSKGSIKGKKFSDYGIKEKNQYKLVKKHYMKVLGIDKDFYSGNGMNIDSIPDTYKTNQTVAYFNRNDIGECDTFFNRIRNAFAHGNFIVYKYKKIKKILFWNINEKGNINGYFNLEEKKLSHLMKAYKSNSQDFLTQIN